MRYTCPMLDVSDPYLPFIAMSYGLAAVALAAMLLIQRHHYRKTRRQLEHFKEMR